MAGEDLECSRTYLPDSVTVTWENMKQYFKLFPYIQEPGEMIGKAVQFGMARWHPVMYSSMDAILAFVTPVPQQVLEWHRKLECGFSPPSVSAELAPWGAGKFSFKAIVAPRIHEGSSEESAITVKLYGVYETDFGFEN